MHQYQTEVERSRPGSNLTCERSYPPASNGLPGLASGRGAAGHVHCWRAVCAVCGGECDRLRAFYGRHS